jgi:hypothetical protein
LLLQQDNAVGDVQPTLVVGFRLEAIVRLDPGHASVAVELQLIQPLRVGEGLTQGFGGLHGRGNGKHRYVREFFAVMAWKSSSSVRCCRLALRSAVVMLDRSTDVSPSGSQEQLQRFDAALHSSTRARKISVPLLSIA